jgi:anti-sigma factor RsiW
VNCDEVGRLLDAYVDNELDLPASAAIAEHVEHCPSCERRLGERESIKRLVQSVPYYTAPVRLRNSVTSRSSRWRVTTRVLASAAVVLLAVSLAGGLATRALRSTPRIGAGGALADAIVSSHVRALMGAHLLDVPSSDQHTVKPWFLGKLDFSPPVVDLVAAGFPLAGGRLEYVDGRPAAAVVYTRRQHTINLFVWPAPNAPAPVDARTIRGFHLRHWIRGGMAFWAISDLNDQELDEFVRLLQ